MSIRRQAGDWVKVNGILYKILPEDTHLQYLNFPCLGFCDDDECKEWSNLESKNGDVLFHVPECHMESIVIEGFEI